MEFFCARDAKAIAFCGPVDFPVKVWSGRVIYFTFSVTLSRQALALWEKSTQTLFSGDVVYDGPLIEDVYHSNLQHYIDSMKRLYDFPVKTVHGGHFASYGGDRHRQIIRIWLDRHDAD